MTDYKTLYDAIVNLNIPIEKQGKFANDKDLWFEYAHFPYIGKGNQSDAVDLNTPLTFEAKADGTKIYLLSTSAENTCSVDVSTDNGKTWTEFTSDVYSEGNNTPIATLDTGEKILVRGNNPDGMMYFSEVEDNYMPAGLFYIDGEAYAYGNVMSLLSKDGFSSMTEVPEYAFGFLFSDWMGEWVNESSLFSHPTKNILLPATTLAESCYDGMFHGCSSLTTAPELPATTLAESCYDGMFHGCTSLNYIKALFTTTPSDTYTKNWVDGVSSTGTFVKNEAATWNVTGEHGIPTGWTVETA